MPLSYSFAVPRDEPAFHVGAAMSSVGASQRAALGRGLAFMLLLAASSLASVYIPLALDGPGWVEGRAPMPRSAAR